MSSYFVKYLSVSSRLYGNYTILQLQDVRARDLKGNPELTDALQENFGDRFVIVQEKEAGERDYFLNENIVGVPTPEFERQIQGGEWKERMLNVA